MRQTDLVLTSNEDELTLTMATGGSLSDVGGALAGLLATHNVDIPKYLAALDDLAGQIISAVNGLHERGYTGRTAGRGVFLSAPERGTWLWRWVRMNWLHRPVRTAATG